MRLSNHVCLHLMRKGLEEILLPELISDAGRDTARVLMRTIDELLLRDQAAQNGLADTIDRSIARCADLLDKSERLGAAAAVDKSRFDSLVRRAQAWRDAPRFTDVERELLLFLEQLATAALSRDEVAVTPEAMALAHEATALEGDLERFVFTHATPPVAAAADAAAMTQQDVTEFLRRVRNESDLSIDRWERIPGGMSKRTYRFFATSKQWGEQPLIVRETAGTPHADFDCWLLANEFVLVRTLHGIGLPVAEPLYLHESGQYYVVRRARGARNSNVFSTTTEMPHGVLLGMADVLAKLHSLAPEQVMDFVKASHNESVLGENVEQCLRRTLLRWRDYSRRMRRLAAPGEYLAFNWLINHIPKNTARPSILHGDFGPHNSLWDDTGITAVLDWEGAHFGDPAFDIGYVKAHISGRMDWREFLDHYHRAGGPAIDEERIAYYERFAMYRTLITTNQAVSRVEFGEKSDLFILQVDWEYWSQFIQQSAEMQTGSGDASTAS
jgi:aminoglycoside phosphotransferase (APT) family kinase protein